MASLIDFACKLAFSRWSLQKSGQSLYQSDGLSDDGICAPFLCPPLNQYCICADLRQHVGDTDIDFPRPPCDVYGSTHFHLIVNPPFPKTTEKANETVKKTERCLFQLDLMQLQIKTRLKDLHKTSLECLLSINTIDEKKREKHNTKCLNEGPPWFIYCTSLLAAAVTCHNS